eukprot:5301212-Alexandrium_andersonii.AAC.1
MTVVVVRLAEVSETSPRPTCPEHRLHRDELRNSIHDCPPTTFVWFACEAVELMPKGVHWWNGKCFDEPVAPPSQQRTPVLQLRTEGCEIRCY